MRDVQGGAIISATFARPCYERRIRSMKNTLLIIGILLLVYWGWQMSKGRSRGMMFDGPARYIIPIIGVGIVGVAFFI